MIDVKDWEQVNWDALEHIIEVLFDDRRVHSGHLLEEQVNLLKRIRDRQYIHSQKQIPMLCQAWAEQVKKEQE